MRSNQSMSVWAPFWLGVNRTKTWLLRGAAIEYLVNSPFCKACLSLSQLTITKCCRSQQTPNKEVEWSCLCNFRFRKSTFRKCLFVSVEYFAWWQITRPLLSEAGVCCLSVRCLILSMKFWEFHWPNFTKAFQLDTLWAVSIYQEHGECLLVCTYTADVLVLWRSVMRVLVMAPSSG